MSIRDMRHTTVEDVLALRQAAIEMEEERGALAVRCNQAERLSDRYRTESRDLYWHAANATSARDNALAERDSAEEERDALAAQLDAVFGAVLRPFVETFSDTEAMAEARRIAMSGPQDILTRRDARIKAEALHELLMFPRMGDEPVRAKAVKLRDGYRQQAEGGSE